MVPSLPDWGGGLPSEGPHDVDQGKLWGYLAGIGVPLSSCLPILGNRLSLMAYGAKRLQVGQLPRATSCDGENMVNLQGSGGPAKNTGEAISTENQTPSLSPILRTINIPSAALEGLALMRRTRNDIKAFLNGAD
jgi:hypothetical protein